MTILTLALAVAISATCEWSAPRGQQAVTAVAPSSLVDRYTDIPADVRARLKARMDARRYDEIVPIRRGSIVGEYQYSDLRDMHFGSHGTKMCRQVTMASWTAADVERALVYTEGGYSIAVPTICRNVSRITRGERVTRGAPPPGPITVQIPPALVEPVPVTADVAAPPVIGEPLEPDLQRRSFGRLSAPEPLTESLPEDEPLQSSTDLPWADYWIRPPFPGVLRFRFFDGAVPVLPVFGPVPPPGPVVPVPGVTPATVASSTPPIRVPVPGGLPGGGLPVSPIPEPAEWLLMLFGLAWVMWQRRKAA